MYIFKVNNGQETLTYTFQNESWGKGGNDTAGINTFIQAFRKLFKDEKDGATLTIMNESGSFYKKGSFVVAKNWEEIVLPLNEQAVKDLTDHMTHRMAHEDEILRLHV